MASCSRTTCPELATQRLVLFDPDGRPLPGDAYCARHMTELRTMLIPSYGRGRPAYRVDAIKGTAP